MQREKKAVRAVSCILSKVGKRNCGISLARFVTRCIMPAIDCIEYATHTAPRIVSTGRMGVERRPRDPIYDSFRLSLRPKQWVVRLDPLCLDAARGAGLFRRPPFKSRGGVRVFS